MSKQDRPVKVSVIVPVYNVEKYVKQCIQSILDQSLEQLEIIVINDGSADGSAEICREMAHQDNRILFFEQENRGLGNTRNHGMTFARGEYLAFVDSDDYLETEYLQQLYEKAMKSDADVVQGEMTRFFERTGELRPGIIYSNCQGIKLDKINLESFYREYYYTNMYAPFACGKMYKHSFVAGINARFGDNNRIFAEDVWFQLQILRSFPRIEFCSGPKYIYRQHSKSIMNSPKKNLIVRQATVVKDYCALICQDNNREVEYKVADLLTEEAFTIEAMNQAKFGGTLKRFCQESQRILNDASMRIRMNHLYTQKAYRLLPRKRSGFVRIIAFLFHIGLYRAALLLYWLAYKSLYRVLRKDV